MLYNYFPVRVRGIIKKCLENYEDIEEIRLRCGQSITFCNRKGKWFLDFCGNFTKKENGSIKLYKDDLREMLKYFTQNSMYAMQQDIRNGFITLTDGTRVGLCGRCIVKNGDVENMNNISSFNIRLSKQICGWGDDVFKQIGVCDRNILIIAPPGLGKTTLLRNLIKYASDAGKNVSVVDEKCEISPFSQGQRIYNLGVNTDVLSDVSKNKGVGIMLRTMNPEIIAVDEILTKEDFQVIKNTSFSGVKIFATFHGKSKEDYISKMKSFGESIEIFDSYISITENDKHQRVITF